MTAYEEYFITSVDVPSKLANFNDGIGDAKCHNQLPQFPSGWVCYRKQGHDGPHEARAGISARGLWYTDSGQL